MSPSIAIILSSLLQAVLRMLDREMDDKDRDSAKELAEEQVDLVNEQFASLRIERKDKDSEVA